MSWRFVIVVVVGAVVFDIGCASTGSNLGAPSLRTDLVPGVAKDDPTDADIVVLHKAQRFFISNPPSRPGVTEFQNHRVVKVLTEAGFAAASAHVFVPDKGTLAFFQARTIAPDGTVYDVDPATVVADTSTAGGSVAGTRSFQFPRVTVGSILELTTTTTAPYARWFLIEDVAEQHPIKHYEVEILLDRFVVPDVFVNNAKPALGYEKNGPGGLQRIAFSLDDIKATTSQPWQPAWRSLHPWWAYRAVEWVFPNARAPAASTWGRAISGSVHDRIAEREGLSGLPPLRGHEACAGNRECIVSAALTQLREALPLTGFDDFFACRPLDDVAGAGGANNHEKALALWKWLNDARLPAQLALTAHGVRVEAAETFPSPIWFDHSLVYLAATSTEPALWIDPSCEDCAVGQIPAWTIGKRAVPLSVVDAQGGAEVRAASFLDVTGTTARLARRQRTATMTVAADGDVTVVEDEVREGRNAVNVILDQATMTDEEIKTEITKGLRDRSRSVVVKQAPRWQCKRAEAVCTRRLEYGLPGIGTVIESDGRIVVPLFALNSGIENLVMDVTPEDRRHDIQFDNDEAFEETVTVVAPEGYVVAEDHKSSVPSKVAGLYAEVAVERKDTTLKVTRRHAITRGLHGRGHWKALQGAMTNSIGARELSVRLQKKPAEATTKAAPAKAATTTK